MADVDAADKLRGSRVHSKRLPKIVLLDSEQMPNRPMLASTELAVHSNIPELLDYLGLPNSHRMMLLCMLFQDLTYAGSASDGAAAAELAIDGRASTAAASR